MIREPGFWRCHKQSRVWQVLLIVLVLSACAPLEGLPPASSEPAASTTVVVPPTSADPAVTSSTTTTTATTITTTAPPAVYHLHLEVEPVVASFTIEGADGSLFTGEDPFDGAVAVPITVSLQADGYNDLTEVIDLDADATFTLWLDRQGQVLHKVTEWTTGPAPKQVAFTPDSREIWVTLLGGSGFEVFDPHTGQRLAAVDLPEAGSVEVIFNAAGTKAYISQMETASVYEVDVASRGVLRRLDTEGVWTKVIVLSPDELTLWAANWVSNDVSEIDLATGEVRRRFTTVTTPRGLYVTPDGARMYVAGFENGEIQVFDLASLESEVIYRSGGAMRHLVGDPERHRVYASDMARAHVLEIDTITNEVTELAAVDRVPNTIDLSPDGRMLFVSNRGRNNSETYYKPGPEWGSVVVVDTATGAYVDALVGGNQTTGLDVSPDGTMLAFSDFLDNRVTVYTIPSYEDLAAGGGGRWETHLREIRK